MHQQGRVGWVMLGDNMKTFSNAPAYLFKYPIRCCMALNGTCQSGCHTLDLGQLAGIRLEHIFRRSQMFHQAIEQQIADARDTF